MVFPTVKFLSSPVGWQKNTPKLLCPSIWSWWFQPPWKIWKSNWIIIPTIGENKICLGEISTPLKNMSSSVGMILPKIWKKSHSMVPNHQPGLIPMTSPIFLWFSYIFLWVFLWNHHFPMVFPWFSQFEALTQEPPWEPASEASRPRLAGSPMTSIQDGEAPRSPIRSYQGLPQSMIQRDFQTCDWGLYTIFYSILLYCMLMYILKICI